MGKIIRTVVRVGEKPTPEAIAEVREAYKYPIVFDEDCPEYTYEELLEMKKAAEEKRAAERKSVVTLRLPTNIVEKAKATGKGYTGFLARLIENAIKDKDIVKKSL